VLHDRTIKACSANNGIVIYSDEYEPTHQEFGHSCGGEALHDARNHRFGVILRAGLTESRYDDETDAFGVLTSSKSDQALHARASFF
jgi:hypothetical protein